LRRRRDSEYGEADCDGLYTLAGADDGAVRKPVGVAVLAPAAVATVLVIVLARGLGPRSAQKPKMSMRTSVRMTLQLHHLPVALLYEHRESESDLSLSHHRTPARRGFGDPKLFVRIGNELGEAE
jgi:hypothetical protein